MEEKVNKIIELKEELKEKIKTIFKLNRKYEHGYETEIDFADMCEFFITETDIGIKTISLYEDDGEYSDGYCQFPKELFSKTDEELDAHFREQFKEVILERERRKLESERRREKEIEKRDLLEFKRLNKKFRGQHGKK